MNPRDPLPPGVVEAWRRGEKIEAIKRLRVATGMGLAEAKAALEVLDRGAFAKQARPVSARPGAALGPGEMPRTSQGAVWMITIVALVLALAAWLYAVLA